MELKSLLRFQQSIRWLVETKILRDTCTFCACMVDFKPILCLTYCTKKWAAQKDNPFFLRIELLFNNQNRAKSSFLAVACYHEHATLEITHVDCRTRSVVVDSFHNSSRNIHDHDIFSISFEINRNFIVCRVWNNLEYSFV